MHLQTQLQAFVHDVASILELSAAALRKMPNPDSFEALTRADLFTFVVLAMPFLFAICSLCLLMKSPSRKPIVRETFWLTRVALLKSLGFIYLAAFLTSAFQNRPLFGTYGLDPVVFANRSRPSPVFSLFCDFLGLQFSDWMLELVAWVGVLLALLLIQYPVSSFVLPLLLWTLYLSIVNLGTRITNYGWEWLTLEAGFLAVFLCPFASTTWFPRLTPPSRSVLWLFRWLAFRLLLGAGMSKLGAGSSACWQALECTGKTLID